MDWRVKCGEVIISHCALRDLDKVLGKGTRKVALKLNNTTYSFVRFDAVAEATCLVG
jgi:hypothetical protein